MTFFLRPIAIAAATASLGFMIYYYEKHRRRLLRASEASDVVLLPAQQGLQPNAVCGQVLSSERQLVVAEPAAAAGAAAAAQGSDPARIREELGKHKNVLQPASTLDEIAAGLRSKDVGSQFVAAIGARWILSKQKNPPIQDFIDRDLVPSLVQLLDANDRPDIQLEAAWVLTYIASGTSVQKRAVMSAGAGSKFIRLLSTIHPAVSKQAVCAIGNIAGDGPVLRDALIAGGVVLPLISLITPDASDQLVRMVSWTLCNLCRNVYRPPPKSAVQQCLPVLSLLLGRSDPSVQHLTCWAFYYVTAGSKTRIQMVVDAGVVPRLVDLLCSESSSVIYPALRSIGNIVMGTALHAQSVIDVPGALQAFYALLCHEKASIEKEAARILFKLAAGNINQREALMEAQLDIQVMYLVRKIDYLTRKEARCVVANLTTGGYLRQDQFAQNVSWTVSNPCPNESPPSPESAVRQCLPALLLDHNDRRVQCDAFWAFGYLNDGSIIRIQIFVGTGVVPRLVDLRCSESPSVVAPALRSIRNIVMGTDSHTQLVLATSGALHAFLALLCQKKASIQKAAACILSNVTAGNIKQKQAVIDTQLIPEGDYRTRKEAVWVVASLTAGGDLQQANQVAECGALRHLCDLLVVNDSIVVLDVIDAVKNILTAAGKIGAQTRICKMIKEADGLAKLEALQKHDNGEIGHAVINVICTYFSDQGNCEDGYVAPAATEPVKEENVVQPASTLDEIAAGLWSKDAGSQLAAAIGARTMLTEPEILPIQDFIDHNLVAPLVHLLDADDGSVLQLEAVWALCNIASGTSDQKRAVMCAGAGSKFIRLLSTSHPGVSELAACAIGNIARGGPELRDALIADGVVLPLISLITPDASDQVVRRVSWALRFLCHHVKNNPPAPESAVRQCLPALSLLLGRSDPIIQGHTCWAVSYLTGGSNERIQMVVDAGGVPRLVDLLYSESASVVGPALRSIGNIVLGTALHTELVIDALGALHAFHLLLCHERPGIQKLAAWILFKLSVGNFKQKQAVIDAQLIPKVINLIQKDYYRTRTDGVSVLVNLTTGGYVPHVNHVVECGALPHLCDLLVVNDSIVVLDAIDALENILAASGEIGARTRICEMIEEAGGLVKLEALQKHEKLEICNAAIDVVSTYFSDHGNDEDGSVAPAATEHVKEENVLQPASTLDEVAAGLRSKDVGSQLVAAIGARRMLSEPEVLPIQDFIDHDLVAPLVHLLDADDRSDIQFEAVWALCNISSGTSDQKRAVMCAGGGSKFIRLLSTIHPAVSELAARAIGNIARGGPELRDALIADGVVPPLISLITTNASDQLVQRVSWTLSNLCRNINSPAAASAVQQCLPVLSLLLGRSDPSVQCPTCRAFYYFTDGSKERIQMVVDAGVVPRLVELLYSKSPSVVDPALGSIGNIVLGTDWHTQLVIDAPGALQAFHVLLCHEKACIQKEAAWILATLSGGNFKQKLAVIDAQSIPKVISLIQKDDCKIKREVAWMLANLTTDGYVPHVNHVVACGALPHLCDFLMVNDSVVVLDAIDALENILTAAGKVGAQTRICETIKEAGGLAKLKALQEHENVKISNAVINFIGTYFSKRRLWQR